MLERWSPTEPLRAWSAGCSSGEEVYTLAILLSEALRRSHGKVQAREMFVHSVKIYATDVDQEALQQARHATYPASALQALPEGLRDTYFERSADRYSFQRDLRRSIIFGRHDLIQDPPISRLDLLVCRNTLMYFNADAQRRILARFHFALKDTGFLFLGRAEMLLTHSHLYTPLDLGHRVFAKVPKTNLRDRMVILTQAGDEMAGNQLSQYVRLREKALDASFSAEIVVDRKGNLSLFNNPAMALFNLHTKDLGQPLQDLEIAHQPLDLQSLVKRAQAEHQAVTVQDVKRTLSDGHVQFLDVRAVSLEDREGFPQGTAVSFLDVTAQHQLREEMEEWRQRLASANEELQASNEELETTNEELQASNEELETTNEELHSAIEELQTTNEELQSTSEEMETVNEELQSTNEELHAMNSALRQRTMDSERINAFLESILATIETGVIVINEDLRVLLWNQVAADQWGLRTDEVINRPFLSLDIGLPVQMMKRPLLRFLESFEGEAKLTLAAMNRRGRAVQCFVRCRGLYLDAAGSRRGVVLFVETREQEPGGPGAIPSWEPEEGVRE
jgi:two-component system CheB/CheR fusion protein